MDCHVRGAHLDQRPDPGRIFPTTWDSVPYRPKIPLPYAGSRRPLAPRVGRNDRIETGDPLMSADENKTLVEQFGAAMDRKDTSSTVR